MSETGRDKQYFCRKCGEEISYPRVLYRVGLCIDCYKKMKVDYDNKNKKEVRK